MDYQSLPDWKHVTELRKLLDLSKPPKQLFFKGQWNPHIFRNCIAIVGSRRLTEYGKRVIEKMIPQFVMENKTIVSGFMYGADQYAHELAVQHGGKTIAVLGWGIARQLEEYDKKLAEKIVASGGLLLSEWEDQKATLWTFPVRNRIVAALCTDVFVVEATEKSGSLITANLAIKLQRTVWAVPGPITSRLSEGTNALLASGKAQMWLGEIQHAVSDNPFIRLLQEQALSANDIARKLGKDITEVGAQLSLLTITGEVSEKGGTYYVSKN